MTKCSACGGKMTTARTNYLYQEETGLPVTLAGVEVATCAACGARGPIVPRPLELNAAIVSALARKPGRLAGKEITFLRAGLGLSGRELARLMGTTPTSVSRWEQEKAPAGTAADKLLRLCAVLHAKDAGYTLGDVESAAADESAAPLRITLTFARGAWRRE